MAESRINEIGVDLVRDDFEVSTSSSQNSSWSLGCDITLEDVDASIQEVRVNDITLSGSFSTEELSVDVNIARLNSTELGIDFGVGAIGGGYVDDLNAVKEGLEKVNVSLSGISDAISGINAEAVEIKATINGVQKDVNDIGTELTTKASVDSVISIGEDVTEVQSNLAEQAIRVSSLESEITTKASSESVTKIANDLAIANKTIAEQQIKVNDLSVEITTKANAEQVLEIEGGLRATSSSLAEQIAKVSSIETEISDKASTSSVTSIGDQLVIVQENVAEQIIRTDGLEASIENKVSKDAFNAATGQIASEFTSVKQTADKIETAILAQSGEIATIKENVSGLSVGIGKIEDDINTLRGELDGVTESYFHDYSPANENEPASSWIASGTESEHKGDTFTNISTEGDDAGKSWRWLQDTKGNWSWHPIADTDAQKALLIASQAKEAADGKITIYYTSPFGYKDGDIWFVHNDDYPPYKKGEILSAIRGNSIFDISDWESKTRYTDAVNDLGEIMNTTFRDGVLDDAERKTIVEGLNILNKEKSAVDSRYSVTILNSDFTDESLKQEFKNAKKVYDAAYNDLKAIIEQISVSSENLGGLFESYREISDAYSIAYASYTEKEAKVNEALMGRMNSASVYLENITNDGVLTPIEKEQLYEIYRGIAKEYDAARGNAYNYKLWKYNINGITEESGVNGGDGRYETYVTLKNAYSVIAAIFGTNQWGFDKMDETTELSSEHTTKVLKQYLDDYYSAYGELTEVFSSITAAIEDAQKKAETTLAELTGILTPEEMYTQVGKGVVLSTIIATRDASGNITAGMNASNAHSDKSKEKHGRVVFVGGAKDLNDFNEAAYVVYEDGHVKMSSAEISDYASINALQMGLESKASVSDFNDLLAVVNNVVNTLAKMWRIEDGSIVTDYNIVTSKEISAGGVGEEGDFDAQGTVTGIKVKDGEVISPDNNGTVDLSYVLKDVVDGIDLSNYATKDDVDNRINDIVDGAPAAFDTLKEIAQALEENVNEIGAIITTLEKKAEKSEITALAQEYYAKVNDLEKKDLSQDGVIGGISQRVTTVEGDIAGIREDIVEIGTKDEQQDDTLRRIESDLKHLQDWYDEVGNRFTLSDDGGTINVDLNFATSKELSAGGAGSEMEGEGSGGSLESLSDVRIVDMPSDEYQRASQRIGYENGYWTNKVTMHKHTQSTASTKWVITHNLGKMPNVKVIDSTGELVFGTVVYDTNDLLNKLTITFGGSFAGTAYLD